MSVVWAVGATIIALYFLNVISHGRPKRWTRVFAPENVNRGPNADKEYHGVVLGGVAHAFTDEAVKYARETAIKIGWEG